MHPENKPANAPHPVNVTRWATTHRTTRTCPAVLSWAILALLLCPLHAQVERVDYAKLAFNPKAWEMRGLDTRLVLWPGRQIVFLTPSSHLDPEVMRIWVAKLDAGWDVYSRLTHGTPRLLKHVQGKATIAAVPRADLTCGLGCGYIGATGIEITGFESDIYPLLTRKPDEVPHLLFYEMGRNFYTFGNRHSCFITGFAVFMRYVCMDALKIPDTDAHTRKAIEGAAARLGAGPLSFLETFTHVHRGEKEHRLRDSAGRILLPSDQPVCYAAAMLRLRRENGGDAWVSRFFEELAKCPEAQPASAEGALRQAWHWMICGSVAARKNLAPVFAGEWRLPVSPETLSALEGVNWSTPGLSVSDILSHLHPQWQPL